ncbi:hypothetical protein D9O40_14310 [Clostridium autoethanogenum]|uniref:Uncharacterized protein n=1 Tax=Clostridium autoethanogenum TaxID=84023 RepID=A0A3M0SH00_9CLOT|nr:hypothetical protein [Clostridium autoethanogenum]RMC97798.1 hypothetical protein D9O40_14310 [Clostridium autoethanogenum]
MKRRKLIMKMTKIVYRSFMNKDNNLFDKPFRRLAELELEKERQDFLKDYIDFIMHSDIVAETTKIYIRSPFDSVASSIADYNRTLPEGIKSINIKTAESNCNNNTNKLLEYFPDDMLYSVIYSKNCDLEHYNKLLDLAIAKRCKKNKIFNNLILKLPTDVELQDSLDEDEFSDFVKIIAPYLRTHIKYLEENISCKAVGYLFYLISTRQLYGIDKDRYNLLKEMLK